MEIKDIQENLLLLLPHFNYKIIRPIKQLLDDGVSLEMYYCLQILRTRHKMTMTEFAEYIHVPKHQMSKLSNRLFEQGFIERIFDSTDRRTIEIMVTEKAIAYMDNFRDENTDCYHDFLDKMSLDEISQFGCAIETLLSIFCRISGEETPTRGK